MSVSLGLMRWKSVEEPSGKTYHHDYGVPGTGTRRAALSFG